MRRRLSLVVVLAFALASTAGTARATTPTGVFPFQRCVTLDYPDQVVTAIFDYASANPAVVFVPVGVNNLFAPDPIARGQTEFFFPGVNEDAFEVSFGLYDTHSLTWTLLGNSVTAGVDSPLCEVSINSQPQTLAGPAVLGTPVVGQPLFAQVGGWEGAVAAYGYQWQVEDDSSNWSDIPGADGASYTPVPDDVGHAVRVEVTAASAGHELGTGGATNTMPSDQTDAVAAAPAAGIASITGSPLVGSTLTAHTGTWVNVTSFDYDWQRCAVTCSDTGGTASTYQPTASDVGSSLRVVVTPTGASSPDAVSPETAVIQQPTTPLSVSPASIDFGTVKVGKSLTRSVTVTNTSAAPAQLGGWTRTGAGAAAFRVSSACSLTKPLKAGRTCSVSVSFAPTAPGAQHAQLQVFDSSGGGPAPVPLDGTGA